VYVCFNLLPLAEEVAMRRSALSIGVGLAALGFLVAVPVFGEDKAAPDAKAAFAKMKTLAGEWSSNGEGHGGADHAPKVIYKVTAAGSALMESQFPGSDHEMVSIYHLDGDNLLMTHYCAAGNQPRMKYDPKASKPGEFVFAFDGGTNFDPAKDMHIHNLNVIFHDDKHVDESWDAFVKGKKAMTSKFALTRP
jgi:hypothetical protein